MQMRLKIQAEEAWKSAGVRLDSYQERLDTSSKDWTAAVYFVYCTANLASKKVTLHGILWQVSSHAGKRASEAVLQAQLDSKLPEVKMLCTCPYVAKTVFCQGTQF